MERGLVSTVQEGGGEGSAPDDVHTNEKLICIPANTQPAIEKIKYGNEECGAHRGRQFKG